MDETLCQLFFNQPACPAQRQYEALRAVFIDGISQKEAAQQFGYTYDAFRQLVHQFRHQLTTDTPPPFSPLTAEGIPPEYPDLSPANPTPPIEPMSVC